MNEDIKQKEMEALFGGTPKVDNFNRFLIETPSDLEAKRLKKYREAEADPLINSLEESTHINNELKANMIRLAHLYLPDMRDNILADQFDLTDKYTGTNADEWATFLQDRVVSTYIRKHKNALLKSRAETNLADPYAKNKRDNLNLITRLEDNEKKNQESIVIMRLPDKYED